MERFKRIVFNVRFEHIGILKQKKEVKKVSELPIAAVDRIIRKAGAERVSESAARELSEVLEDYALEMARDAADLSEHAGRKTVRDTDIRLAAKR